MSVMDKLAGKIAVWCNWISMIALTAMLCVLVVDIIGGKLFHSPIAGSIDILSLIVLFVFAFALAKTEILGKHIRVDFLTNRLKKQQQNILKLISAIFTLSILILIIYSTVQYAIMLQNVGGGSQTLEIPFYPFVYALALAFIPLTLLIILEIINSIISVREK